MTFTVHLTCLFLGFLTGLSNIQTVLQLQQTLYLTTFDSVGGHGIFFSICYFNY